MNPLDLFIPQAEAAESGGNPNASNPASSASGILQFTDPTWVSTVAKYGPKYGFSYGDKGNPGAQEKAERALWDNEYQPFFQSHGITDPQASDVYQIHFWGQPNLQAIMSGSPDAPLSATLGDRFGSVYAANKGLFGNNPNITTQQAYDAVTQAWNKAGGKGGTSALPTVSVGTKPAATEMDDTQDDPNAGQLPASVVMSPEALAQQQQGNTGFFTPMNLLRLAAGFAGGKTFGQSIAGAAGNLAQGQMQDLQMQQLAQKTAMERAQLMQGQQRTNAYSLGEAAKLMEFGLPAPVAIGLATGKMNQQDAQSALAGVQQTGGRQTKGDLFYAPDGTPIQEMQSRFGPPTYYNASTGQPMKTLPTGSFRAQDSGFMLRNKAEVGAENSGMNDAMSAQKQNAVLQSVLDVLPSVNQGGDVASTLRRNLANLTGGDTAAAQGLMTNLFQQLNMSRMQMLRGYGQVRTSELDMLKGSGGNWMLQPSALKAVVDYTMRNNNRAVDMQHDWDSADDATRQHGYRNFVLSWQKSHPLQGMSVAGGGNGDAGGGDSGSSRPPLSSFEK